MKGHRKGQAAMEYLMTYGWAFLVILVVLAILAYYLSTIQIPETCLFMQSGFGCEQHLLVSEAGTNSVFLLFELENQQGQGINVTRVKCTEETGEITKPGPIESGPVKINAGQGQEFTVKYCVDESGNTISLNPNSNFQGTIAVWYNYQNDLTGAPERLATASVSGKVVGE
jgi:hypothetical protein